MPDGFGIDWNLLANSESPLNGYIRGKQYADQQQQNMLANARQARVDARQQTEWSREDEARTTQKAAFSKYGAGDTTGARQAAFDSGSPELISAISSLDAAGRQQAAERADKLGRVAYGLMYDPSGRARSDQEIAAAYEAAKPDLAAHFKPEDLAGFQPSRQSLTNFVNQTMSVKDLLDQADKRSKPIEMDPKKTYYMRDEGGQAPAMGTATVDTSGNPVPPPPGFPGEDADATWRAMIQRESGGRPGVTGPQTPYGQAQGMTQMLPATAQAMANKLGVAWRPDLMTAKTPEAAAYQEKLGRAYYDEGLQKYGGDQHMAAMYYHGGPDQKLWGPKTRAYADAVAPTNMTGGAGNDQLAQNAPQIPGYRLISQGQRQPDWRSDGKGNLINAETGDRKPDPTVRSPEWTSDGKGNLVNAKTGDRKLDPTAPGEGLDQLVDPKIVKGLIDGRIAPPSGMAASKPYWQAQIRAAATQDPTFDAVNYQARAKARSDFTSGKSAQNITALNTVIGHLDHLDRTIDALGNYGPGGAGNLGPINQLNNSAARGLAQWSGTDARYQDFETAKTAVANELTRVFRGTGGAEADIQGWMKKLDSAGSPKALHTVVQSMAELINSRIEALGEQYNQGMGTTQDPIRLLTPDKQKAFERMRGGASQSQSGGDPLAQARAAIAKGADRAAVIQRLRQHGVNPAGL